MSGCERRKEWIVTTSNKRCFYVNIVGICMFDDEVHVCNYDECSLKID